MVLYSYRLYQKPIRLHECINSTIATTMSTYFSVFYKNNDSKALRMIQKRIWELVN